MESSLISPTDPETLQKWAHYYQTSCTTPLLAYHPLDQEKCQIRLITPCPESEYSLSISSENCLPEEQCAAQKTAVSYSLHDHPHLLPRFTLEEVSLADNPSYSAFSYAWGPEYPKRAIIVDGQVHLLTKNLFAALINVHVPTSKI